MTVALMPSARGRHHRKTCAKLRGGTTGHKVKIPRLTVLCPSTDGRQGTPTINQHISSNQTVTGDNKAVNRHTWPRRLHMQNSYKNYHQNAYMGHENVCVFVIVARNAMIPGTSWHASPCPSAQHGHQNAERKPHA